MKGWEGESKRSNLSLLKLKMLKKDLKYNEKKFLEILNQNLIFRVEESLCLKPWICYKVRNFARNLH